MTDFRNTIKSARFPREQRQFCQTINRHETAIIGRNITGRGGVPILIFMGAGIFSLSNMYRTKVSETGGSCFGRWLSKRRKDYFQNSNSTKEILKEKCLHPILFRDACILGAQTKYSARFPCENVRLSHCTYCSIMPPPPARNGDCKSKFG